MANQISKLCANQLPGVFFNSAISPNGQLAIESRSDKTTWFSIYELNTGELLSDAQARNLTPWHSLAACDETSLVLRHFKNQQNPDMVSFIRYDPESDQLIEEVELDSINQPYLDHSSLYLPESENFEMVAQFLDQPLVLGCEYLEQDELIIICYYLLKEKGFERKLLVLKNGKEVLHEVQDEKMRGFAGGSFFTFKDRLCFVKENIELNIYAI